MTTGPQTLVALRNWHGPDKDRKDVFLLIIQIAVFPIGVAWIRSSIYWNDESNLCPIPRATANSIFVSCMVVA